MGRFFESLNRTAIPRVDGGDVIDVDIAEQRRALGERFYQGSSYSARKRMMALRTFLRRKLEATMSSTMPPRPRVLLMPNAVVGAVAVQSRKRTWRTLPDSSLPMAQTLWAWATWQRMYVTYFGGAIHFATFFIAAGLDSERVIAHVGKAIMHHDVAAGVGVQGVGVGRIGRVDDLAVTDVDVLAVEQVDGPERRIDEARTFDADARCSL